MENSSPVPKTGQIIKQSSISQMVIKKSVALGCIGKMHIVALKVPFHKANERGFRHPESKNRSMVKARFRHPITDMAFKAYNLHRVFAVIHDGNRASMNCFAQVGFHHEGRLREARYVHGKFIDLHYYAVLEDEWES